MSYRKKLNEIKGLRVFVLPVNSTTSNSEVYIKSDRELFLPVCFYDKQGNPVPRANVRLLRAPAAEVLRTFFDEELPSVDYISESALSDNYSLQVLNGAKPVYCVCYAHHYESKGTLEDSIKNLIKKLS